MSATTIDFQVTGMTCGHCEMSVREEVGEVAGVSTVDASHEAGTVTVSGEGFTDEAVTTAIEEAGYKLA